MVGIASKILPLGNDELEVTLIGGSSGYGESVVVRYGNNEWAIVDSCVDVINQTCLPIAYLKEIGVNIKEQVKYVICTHWHDDHIQGLHIILDECSSDVFFCVAIASEKLKFLYEIERSNLYEPDRGVRKELILAMDKVKEKGIKVIRLLQDLPVFETDECVCKALSPSQKELELFYDELAHATAEQGKLLEQKEKLSALSTDKIKNADEISEEIFATLETELGINEEELTKDDFADLDKLKGNDKVTKPNINDRSVALLFTVKGHHVVLGADLEVSSDSECGWQSVNDCLSMKGVNAGIFKIAHHGSKTGYYELFLRNHIKSTATGKLTTWIKGKKVRPEKDTLSKYHQYLSKLYITTDPSYLTGKFTTPIYRHVMEETTESIVDIKNQIGIVQSRLDLNSGTDDWSTKVYGSAKVVTQELINRIA